jgi:deazaflavin-dependent oxidoreductase (nitroreductase family)
MRPPKSLIRALGRVHGTVYRATGGRVLGRIGDARVILVTTTGRRSGVSRTVPLLCIQDGEDRVIVASQAGHDAYPGWYLNLRANPDATMQIGRRVIPVRATEAGAGEADRLWARLVAAYPAWEGYRGRTRRRFPVVILRAQARGDPVTDA